MKLYVIQVVMLADEKLPSAESILVEVTTPIIADINSDDGRSITLLANLISIIKDDADVSELCKQSVTLTLTQSSICESIHVKLAICIFCKLFVCNIMSTNIHNEGAHTYTMIILLKIACRESTYLM